MLISCTEDVKPTPFSYTQIFSGKTSKTWKIKTIAFIEVDRPVQILSVNACLLDDLYIFYANEERLFEIKDGTIKCDKKDPDLLISDTWSFVNATASLSIILPFLADFALPYIVKEVDKNDMTLEIYLDDEGTQSYQMKFKAIEEK